MNSSEIRQSFIDYFAKQNHHVVASSSLVPTNDATLLFTNAGMVPFKDVFLGVDARPYKRATSAQRCVRAGGKHNDLENVGYTARHHTFFEMLGNFSFGDYFKREAIAYAWEFLTGVLNLPAERLWITVYKDDDEAADIWLKEIGVSPDRFSRCGDDDNFWSMGDTGPCGPCTEIFYDHGSDIPGGPPGSEDADGDRYIEIWNLVFMQYNRDKKGTLHPLPKPSVDTGMGLERIAAVVQGVHTNYQIDSFQHIIKAIVAMTDGVKTNHSSLNVIADHIRACAFLIADGVIPSNEGRGYVLRRIIRRAVRHGNKLGLPTPFFCNLITPLIDVMGEAYPELVAHKNQIERTLAQEENQFAKTLEHGLRLLQAHITELHDKEIAGDVAFKLYDTFGFPIDLTSDIAREQGLHVDMEGFERCMQQQREQSQSASQFNVDYSGVEQLSDVVTTFHGYDLNHMESEVVAILDNGKKIKELSSGSNAAIVLKHSPFYAESGGQVGDQGFLRSDKAVFRVNDTQRLGQAIVHYGELVEGTLTTGTRVKADIDVERRAAIRRNHSATHLLHAALKLVLGEQVSQRGSLVSDVRTRFDFAHFEALTITQIKQLESIVNDNILANHKVITEIMPIEEAKQQGAVALFGEKYSDAVRVLSLGKFSKELCGGTHVKRTGDIGLFKIITEYGVASGVRRIEMVTGSHALDWVNNQLDLLNEVALKLKTTPATVAEKVTQLVQEGRKLEKDLAHIQAKLASQSGQAMLSTVKQIGDINFLVKRLEPEEGQSSRVILDQLKSSLNDAVIVLYSIDSGKINVIAGVSKSVLGKVPPAAAYVKQLCGKGGGRDDMAQGGGPVPDDLDEKLAHLSTMIADYT